ncbi:MAG TPA: DUF3300 domain-containing protein [Edaphobacter sp.]|nr:DUF3300 domain-containing protein [Edaphobacter sp.]
MISTVGGEMGQVEAVRRLRRFVALAMAFFLVLMGQGELLAQQAFYGPGAAPGYSQPVYPQPQLYNQQAYAPRPYAPYSQPSYGYGYGYPSQTYQQPYSVPAQSYPLQGYSQQRSGTAQSAAQGLNAQQLEQLVAPIALYPDTLMAQILAAATYPGQVVEADRWRRAQGNAGADQIAGGADLQSWDPSVKGLTAFPQVLAEMDQNLGWTSALGSAYYNQPQDVLEAVQVLRRRAEAAGNLQSTPQQSVSYNQDNVVVQPPDPQMVYVPSYDPWTVYGDPVTPYPGFSLLGALGSLFDSSIGSSAVQFGLGIAMNAFSHMSWGWLGWGLNWLAQAIFFHQSNYFTQSTTVADWGLPHGGPRAYPGGAGAHGFYGSSNGYGRGGGGYGGLIRTGAPIVRMPAYGGNRTGQGYGLGYQGRGYQSQGYQGQGNQRQGYSRSFQLAYNHEPQIGRRPQQGYGGEGFYGRAGAGYGGSMQAYRAPAATYGRGNSYSRGSNSFMSKNDMRGWKAPSNSGGSHFFGGGQSFGGGHPPKAPKGFGGHSGGGAAMAVGVAMVADIIEER